MLTDEDYALKRRWDLFCHELLEEISMKMRGAFPALKSKPVKPVPLEVLAEAWHSLPLTSYSYFTRRLSELWEKAGGVEEPPSERELAEIRGDERYHAMADGERY